MRFPPFCDSFKVELGATAVAVPSCTWVIVHHRLRKEVTCDSTLLL
jgi:hypothetical protein